MPKLLLPAGFDNEPAVWADGFLAGWDHALVAVAANAAELTPEIVARGELLNRDRIAEQHAVYERCAAQLHERLGRPAGYVYRGGPVPWDAGEVWHAGRLMSIPELVQHVVVNA